LEAAAGVISETSVAVVAAAIMEETVVTINSTANSRNESHTYMKFSASFLSFGLLDCCTNIRIMSMSLSWGFSVSCKRTIYVHVDGLW
jgi:hypothetical protein